jgi:hypothetical protein
MSRQNPRTIRKYLFVRESYLDKRPCYVSVEAHDRDHAILRLREKYPFVEKMDWHYLDELDPEHFLGALGEDLPLLEKTRIAGIVSNLIH